MALAPLVVEVVLPVVGETLMVVVVAGFLLVEEAEEKVVTLQPLVMEELPPDTVVVELLVMELEFEELPVAAAGELRLAAELSPELELRAVAMGGFCRPW